MKGFAAGSGSASNFRIWEAKNLLVLQIRNTAFNQYYDKKIFKGRKNVWIGSGSAILIKDAWIRSRT
jgi:hypothetical protein